VRFHGFVSQSELSRIYEACEVFTLLPIDEPFGMVFPEAAARGLLMVGPDHGGPWEILDEGKLGFVADPFSAESLSEIYRRIASMSDHEVDRKREAADASCRARFSESTIMSQMNSVYELEG
jgi:phosphatidylinositol alpha 1,6-mannosyltransferase